MKSIYILILFLSGLLHAQENAFTAIVYYDYTIQLRGPNSKYFINSSLQFNERESIYEMDHSDIFPFTSDDRIRKNSVDKDDINTISLKTKRNEFVYKNYKKNEMYYIHNISMEDFNIKSSLDTIMSWTITEETKTILGYTCYKAATEYGGKYFIAYFTREIPINNGPWRFHGLPGLILEIKSSDETFILEAKSLEINEEPLDISNPYKYDNSISWDKFLIIYKQKYDEIRENSMTEWGPSESIPKKGLLVYIKD